MRIIKTVFSAVSILCLSVALSAGLSGICSSSAYAVDVLVDEDFIGFSTWDPNPNNEFILESTAKFDATSWNKFGTATTINGTAYAAGDTKPWTWSRAMGTRYEVQLKDQAKYFVDTNHFADNWLSIGTGSAGNVVELHTNTQVKLTFTPPEDGDYVISFNYNPSLEPVYRFNDDGSQNTQPPALFTTDVYTVMMETGSVTTTLKSIKPQELFQNSADYTVFYDTGKNLRWYISAGTGSRFTQFTQTVALTALQPVTLTFDVVELPQIDSSSDTSLNGYWGGSEFLISNIMVGPTAGATAFADEDYEDANKLYSPLHTAAYAVSTGTLPFGVGAAKYKIQPSDGTLVEMDTTDKYGQMVVLNDRLTALLMTLPEHKSNGEYQNIKAANDIVTGFLGSQSSYTTNVAIIDNTMRSNFGKIVWILHEYFLDSLFSWDAQDLVNSSSGDPDWQP